MSTSPVCFILKRPIAPWGDYGNILLHGMSAHLGRENGKIQLERTGPFIPPISFPGIGDLVITDKLRQRLETSGLSGLKFQPVIKRLIVWCPWDEWDQSASEPAEYPESGEPEDYILGQEHSDEASAWIGQLWELVPEVVATTDRSNGIRNVRSSIDDSDFFRVGYNYVSERARQWLVKEVSKWVRFETPS